MTGGERIFIHISAFRNPARRPCLDGIVTYTPATDKKGRPCAIDATLSGDRLNRGVKKSSPHNRSRLQIRLAAVFLALATVVTLLGRIPLPVFGLYPVLSLVTYFAYALDKSAAKKGAWRTQESTLHVLSLLGGWPGALLAQQKLRHKSSKREFRLVFWVTVLMNCSVFLWLLTESGYQFVQGLAVLGNG
jgi:uncharacterized membrane protein YsdA (DUF1294 family)